MAGPGCLLRRAAGAGAPRHHDAARVAAGQRSREHHCTSCYRPGLTASSRPRGLAGQDFAYLLRLLRAFKARTARTSTGR